MKREFTLKSSSRSVFMRDIMLFLFRPILRIETLRNDEAGKGEYRSGANLTARQGMHSYMPLRCIVGRCPTYKQTDTLKKNTFRQTHCVGFTLIELLVVVLIIGILAAIAFPKYQTAIDKSRYAALMPLAKSIANAQEAYYMASGKYSPDLAYLDVQLPTAPAGTQANIGDGTTVEISDDEKYDYVKISKDNLENNYIIYQNQASNFPSEIHCEALKNSDRAARLCETLGGEPKSGTMTLGYDTYVLEGDGNGKFKQPSFAQNWYAVGVPQETIEKMMEAMTFLKEIEKSYSRYYEAHGTYPSNFDQLDIAVPNNLRAGGWAYTDGNNPNTYVFSCNPGANASCIANAASKDLPMFQYRSHPNPYQSSCSAYGGKTANVYNICENMSASSSSGEYYYIQEDFDEL